MHDFNAITSIRVSMVGSIPFEVTEVGDGVQVRFGPYAFVHDLDEMQRAIRAVARQLDQLAQGNLPDVNAISGEHPAAGGE